MPILDSHLKIYRVDFLENWYNKKFIYKWLSNNNRRNCRELILSRKIIKNVLPNTWQSSQNIELTFWRIDIIKDSYINDCPTTIGETVENYFCRERSYQYLTVISKNRVDFLENWYYKKFIYKSLSNNNWRNLKLQSWQIHKMVLKNIQRNCSVALFLPFYDCFTP